MFKGIILYSCFLISFISYVNFFIWYLGDQKIFVEDALYRSLSASIPTYVLIMIIHIFYYPSHKKDYAGVISFPPIIWLLSINTGFTIATLNMYYYQYYKLPDFLAFMRSWEVGGILFIIGFSFIVIAIGKFKYFNEDPNPVSSTTMIIDDGIYRVSRNPMYLGLIILQISLGSILSMLHISFMSVITYLIFKYYVIYPEERYLTEKFGDEYIKYRSVVRRWI